jgi:S-adenosylmethionine hydrolase
VARIIALLTDFGTADSYLGSMKGAILSVYPEATLVDLVHDLPAHDVLAGALALDAAYAAFPAGTVFVAVVDPGVGSARRGLAIEAGGCVFVGPDNGIFTFVLREHAQSRLHALESARLFRAPVSPVFHGRDVFGPVAGHLARGLALEDVGPAVRDPVVLDVPEPRRLEGGDWDVRVVHVDRFGNLTTNLRAGALEWTSGPEVVVDGRPVPVVRTYADVPFGTACALVGSHGRLEIAVREGRASDLFGVAPRVRVRVRGPGDAAAL